MMKNLKKFVSLAFITTTITLIINLLFVHPFDYSAKAQTVINLTQTGCQFLETEGKNYNYQPQNVSDCQKINQQTIEQREQSFNPISLSAGKYIFRVTNENVPYELGFYLRGQGASKVFLPKVSGGGLKEGITKDYAIDLKKGKYYMSCPLNPTPDYPLIVQ